MSWQSPVPLESTWWRNALNNRPSDLFGFLREIFQRHRTFGTFTWNPPSVGAGSSTDTTLTAAAVPELEGLRAGQPIYVSPPAAINPGLGALAWVPADDSLTIRLINVTAGSIDPAQGTWAFQGVIA